MNLFFQRARAAGRMFPPHAALLFAIVLCLCNPAAAAQAAPETALPGASDATRLPDGLTVVARKATASPTAALELWIRCPASGYGTPRPGLARLTALAIVEEKTGGSSLRDEARKAGGQISISVYQESTEIAILAPAYVSDKLLDKISARALRPHLDQKAFEAARQRLAAQQVASMDMPDQVLRDSLFARLFASGPLHDSSFGDPKTLTGLTLDDVAAFALRAYVPADEIIVAVGDVDEGEIAKRVAAAAPPNGAAQAVPESTVAAYSDVPFALSRESIAAGGIAIGWVGPPIADRRAATAMDFLSDYLANPSEGVLSKIVAASDPNASFVGQFVTLRNPGVFYLTVYGEKLDPMIASPLIRDAMNTALRRQLSKNEFEQARTAFVSHLVRDMQTAQGLADNYGWYFAQGALTYSPSSTGPGLSGEYFQAVASLTPDYVFSVARRYLQAKPAVVILPRGPLHISGAQ